MAFPVADGHPQYSGKFIPQIWSGKLLEKFYDATVFGSIANTSYDGEISKFGDKVTIRTVPAITIRDYQKGATLQVEKPDAPVVELGIDRGKYFNFIVDSVDRMQSDLDLMDQWAEAAGEEMKMAIDREILGTIYADVAAANKGLTAGRKSIGINLGATGAPVALTKDNIVDVIVDMGTVLDEQSVPETDRWLVLPAWARGLIKKSDVKSASLTGDSESLLRNGRIGMIDRFTIFMSNNVASVGDGAYTAYFIMAGHRNGLTFASQMTEIDTLKSEATFGSIVRGLNVYGAEVVKPEALALLYARKG